MNTTQEGNTATAAVPAFPRPSHADDQVDPSLHRAIEHARQPRSGGALFGRWLLLLVGIAVVLAVLGFLKFRQIQAGIAMGAKMAPPPPSVTSAVIHGETWQPTLKTIGSLEAVQGTTISADLPGVVKEILFQSGQEVKAGDILVRLVTDQEQAELEAAQAQRDLASYSLRRQRDLLTQKANAQADLDNAEANQRQAQANVADKQAAIARKTLRAPFAGRVGIRQANLGQYLNSGAPVVTLQTVDPIYVNFSLPQQYLDQVKVGTEIKIRTDATGDTVFPGKVTAINALVDESTRNFQAQATLGNPDGRLRAGMFSNVEVTLPGQQKVLPVPSSAVNYAPFGNSVFVVREGVQDPTGKKTYKGVIQQFIKLGDKRGDVVAVLSGLKDGDEVVTSGVFKLQNKGPVNINNSVQPGAEENPNPEES